MIIIAKLEIDIADDELEAWIAKGRTRDDAVAEMESAEFRLEIADLSCMFRISDAVED